MTNKAEASDKGTKRKVKHSVGKIPGENQRKSRVTQLPYVYIYARQG